ncbi:MULTISPECIES: hypothetical protein [Bacteria]|uniref:hypothetical protein n=1 Tax=Bacteria TaxID=2 RepID=UPI0036F8252E
MSFLFDLDEKSEAVVSFISRVRDELLRAYRSEKLEKKISLQVIADKIDGDKSTIHRQLNGEGNLTLRTVAELSWAFDKEPFFELRHREVAAEHIRSDYEVVRPRMASSSEIMLFSQNGAVISTSSSKNVSKMTVVAA